MAGMEGGDRRYQDLTGQADILGSFLDARHPSGRIRKQSYFGVCFDQVPEELRMELLDDWIVWSFTGCGGDIGGCAVN